MNKLLLIIYVLLGSIKLVIIKELDKKNFNQITLQVLMIFIGEFLCIFTVRKFDSIIATKAKQAVSPHCFAKHQGD